MVKTVIFGLLLTFLSNVSFACYRPPITLSELNQQPIERVMSQNGKFLLEMHPAKWTQNGKTFSKTNESLGIVYSVKDDGFLSQLWKTEGVYNRGYDLHINPFFFDNLIHYITNDGSKIIGIALTRKLNLARNRSKNIEPYTFVKVVSREGVLTELTNDQLKGALVYGCGLVVIKSQQITPEGHIEIITFGGSRFPEKEWLLDSKTGNLRRVR